MDAKVCPNCSAPPTVAKVTTADLYMFVCSSNNCSTVGARRPTQNKAMSAWNSLWTPNTAITVRGVIGKPGLKTAKTPKRVIPVTDDLATVRIRKDKTVSKSGPRPSGVGAYIREQLSAGADTKTVLERVKKKFPESKATAADVSWNRRKLAGKE